MYDVLIVIVVVVIVCVVVVVVVVVKPSASAVSAMVGVMLKSWDPPDTERLQLHLLIYSVTLTLERYSASEGFVSASRHVTCKRLDIKNSKEGTQFLLPRSYATKILRVETALKIAGENNQEYFTG